MFHCRTSSMPVAACCFCDFLCATEQAVRCCASVLQCNWNKCGKCSPCSGSSALTALPLCVLLCRSIQCCWPSSPKAEKCKLTWMTACSYKWLFLAAASSQPESCRGNILTLLGMFSEVSAVPPAPGCYWWGLWPQSWNAALAETVKWNKSSMSAANVKLQIKHPALSMRSFR